MEIKDNKEVVNDACIKEGTGAVAAYNPIATDQIIAFGDDDMVFSGGVETMSKVPLTTPFNLPFVACNWNRILAMVCGNDIVWKPYSNVLKRHLIYAYLEVNFACQERKPSA